MVKPYVKMSEKEINTETLILNAAKKVFMQKGFGATRMQQIADEAGINKSLLHYYFRTKEKLFDAIFEEVLSQVIPKISRVITSDCPFFEKIELFADTYISAFQKNPHFPMFVLHELSSNPEKILPRFKNHIGDISKIFPHIKKEISSANNYIDAEQLIINMLSLCIFPIIAKPILKGILFNNDENKYLEFIEKRKKEIPKFVINSIKK